MLKTTLLSIAASALVVASASSAVAQASPKILVVDMAKLLDTHYKTIEQNEKLKGDQQKARDQIELLNKEGNDLVADYKATVEKAQNPTLSSDAKSKAEEEAKKKLEGIQKKQQELQNFQAQTNQAFQQRIKTFRDMMLEEIGKIATNIAKKKGATLLLDKSGPSLIGINGLIYYDPSYDITDEVAAEINKERPASVAAPSTSSSTSSKPATDDEPLFKMPK